MSWAVKATVVMSGEAMLDYSYQSGRAIVGVGGRDARGRRDRGHDLVDRELPGDGALREVAGRIHVHRARKGQPLGIAGEDLRPVPQGVGDAR